MRGRAGSGWRAGSTRATTAMCVLLLAACDSRPAPEPPETSESTAAEVEAPVDSVVDAARDTGSAQSAAGTADRTAWRPLAVPAASAPDTYPLVVRNPHGMPLAVFADGGAGEVLLDTVPAGDSMRVRLLIAADSVTLRAVAPDGTEGPPERVSLQQESEARWDARF